MTSLELYKFIQENNIEFHWETNDKINERDVIIFINLWHLEAFCELAGASTFDDYGIQCVLKQSYICLWMSDLCERWDIDLEDIFGKDIND